MSCFPGTTTLEQLLLLQGSCSNVRAFTQHTHPVFSSPARRTIKQYRADTIFLDESSRPHLRAGVYTKRRESNSDPTVLRGDSRRLTFGFAPHTYVNFTPIFLDRTNCVHRCFRCSYTTANNMSYQESSWITVIPEKILTEAVLAIRKDYKG